ncbi:MAG: Gfo/Idh/MocA family oxidoreductase [Armatimonadota bacterium]|nr:Gfo/Idh/MocA family oxidoreductase [Armatimonadota bacterium]
MTEFAVGVVGAASRGRSFFKPFMCNPHTRVEALCDINEEGCKKSAETIGVSKVYTDYEEMLDKSGVNMVVIGTPMPLHVPQSLMALERNIHVLSEVPAAVSIEEAKELVLAVNKSKAKYMMAENYCYIRSNVLVRELAKAGLFGEMYFAEGEYLHELKELNEITKWRRKWQTGINGNVYPTHSLGPILQWLGDDRVVSVCCAGSGHHYKDPRGDYYENEDSTSMMCRTAKGGLINLRLDMLSNRPHNMTYYSLQGTDGCYESARGFGDQPKIWLKSKSEKIEWNALKDLEEEYLPDWWLHPPKEALEAGHGGGDYWQVQDFVQAILDDKEPPIGIHEAMDMTLPGLVSQQSIMQNSAWLPVPDSREW